MSNKSRKAFISPVNNQPRSFAAHRSTIPLRPAPVKLGKHINTVTLANGGTAFMANPGEGLRNAGITAAKYAYDNREQIMKIVKEKAPIIASVFQSAPKSIQVSNSSYGLSKAPNPRPISLNSGIKPNTFVNDYMTSVENACVPLHMSCVRLKLPTAATKSLTSYVEKTVLFDLQTRAQSSIGFDLNIATQFSTAQLLAAFNCAIDSLQIYFFYSSILSYESDTRNKNEGMVALRAMITPQIISDLAMLGNRLEDTPIPPRIVEWVRYMNGNFLSGNTQGSPLLKICYDPTILLGTNITAVSSSLTDLNSAANSTVFALLRRAIPKWRVGKLYDVPTSPAYDANFTTIFTNLPHIWWNGTIAVYSRPVATTDVSVPYASYTNNLDGLAFAMCGIFATGVGFLPGLVDIPFPISTTSNDTRLSFATIGGVTKFYPASANSFINDSRSDVDYKAVITGSVKYVHSYGTDKCQNVSANTLNQSARAAVDFLFNIESLPINGKLAHLKGTK